MYYQFNLNIQRYTKPSLVGWVFSNGYRQEAVLFNSIMWLNQLKMFVPQFEE